MSRLSLLRTSITSNFSVRALRSHNRGFPSPLLLLLLRESPRCFSTQSEQKLPTDPGVDSFLTTPETGLVYGRLYGSITKNTLKTDIVNMLEGCNLRLEDVKVEYNRSLTPVQAIVQFSSPQAFEQAIRAVRSRPFRLDKADRSHWDRVSVPHDAKTVLLQGIPPNALAEDVERFLSGLEHDSSSIQMFYRLMSSSDRIRMATVRFPTTTEAMNAVIKKNRAFCLNNQITVRVLQ